MAKNKSYHISYTSKKCKETGNTSYPESINEMNSGIARKSRKWTNGDGIKII